MRWGLEPIEWSDLWRTYLFYFNTKNECMRAFSEIHVSLMLQSVLSFFVWLYFPCVTLHSVFSSYLEHSVWWLEFICLCSIHRFRYYMIFSTKVDMEFVLDALYWWVVPSSFLFHLDKWNDCNYVIILPFISLVYTYLWSFICIWLHAQWICDCFNRTNKSLNMAL